jgi:hypothetical protein
MEVGWLDYNGTLDIKSRRSDGFSGEERSEVFLGHMFRRLKVLLLADLLAVQTVKTLLSFF